MASLFPAIREIFCSGAPALPRSPSRKGSRIVLRMLCAERTSPIKEAPENAGESRQSKNLRGSGGKLGGGCEGGRRVHALRSWKNLIQPERHVSTMAHARAQEKPSTDPPHTSRPPLWSNALLLLPENGSENRTPPPVQAMIIRRPAALPRTTGPCPCLPACPEQLKLSSTA